MAEVVAINRYAVRDAAGFDRAVAALVDRVRTAGHPGVQGYHFSRPLPANQIFERYLAPQHGGTRKDGTG